MSFVRGRDHAPVSNRAASIRALSTRTGLYCKDSPPSAPGKRTAEVCARAGGVEVGPVNEWICKELQPDPAIQSLPVRKMASELD